MLFSSNNYPVILWPWSQPSAINVMSPLQKSHGPHASVLFKLSSTRYTNTFMHKTSLHNSQSYPSLSSSKVSKCLRRSWTSIFKRSSRYLLFGIDLYNSSTMSHWSFSFFHLIDHQFALDIVSRPFLFSLSIRGRPQMLLSNPLASKV